MRLRGAGIGAGTAIGTAAVVRMMSGIPLPPEIPPRIVAQKASGRNSDLPDVIVVAEEYRIGLAIAGAISWANVVGIASVSPKSANEPSPFPAVTGLFNLLEVVEDDMLLLLDASQDVLLVDPDPVAIAQYQAEAEGLAPKRRVFLNDAHLPAKTLDGHTMQIVAHVKTPQDMTTAITNGADALDVWVDSVDLGEPYLLRGNADDHALHQQLFALVEQAAGKPVFISDNYTLPPALIMEAAGRIDLTLISPVREDLSGFGMAERIAEFREAETECLENEIRYATPRIFASLGDAYDPYETQKEIAWIDELAATGVSGIEYRLDEGDVETFTRTVQAVMSAAEANLIRKTIRLSISDFREEGFWKHDIRPMLAMGVNSVVAPAKHVSEIKAYINQTLYSECKDELIYLLNREAGA